jgi:hypothetical protein
MKSLTEKNKKSSGSKNAYYYYIKGIHRFFCECPFFISVKDNGFWKWSSKKGSRASSSSRISPSRMKNSSLKDNQQQTISHFTQYSVKYNVIFFPCRKPGRRGWHTEGRSFEPVVEDASGGYPIILKYIPRVTKMMERIEKIEN